MAITSFGKGFLPTPAACVKMSLWKCRCTSRFKHAHAVPTGVSNVTKPTAIGHKYCCAMHGACGAVSCHVIVAWRCVCVCVRYAFECLPCSVCAYIETFSRAEQGSDVTCIHMSYLHLLLIHAYFLALIYAVYVTLECIGQYWTVLDK